MEAYHLRTREAGDCLIGGPLGLDLITVDSLFVDEANFLIGYVQDNERAGEIRSYDGEGRLGALKILRDASLSRKAVISKIDLDQEIIDRIKDLYHLHPEEYRSKYLTESKVRLSWDYQGTTSELLRILTRGFTENNNSGGRKRKGINVKRVLERLFPPVLRPIPELNI